MMAEAISDGYVQKVDGKYFGTERLRDFDACLFDNGREGYRMSMKQTFDWISEKFSDRLEKMDKKQRKKVVKKIAYDLKNCRCGILKPESPEERWEIGSLPGAGGKAKIITDRYFHQ